MKPPSTIRIGAYDVKIEVHAKLYNDQELYGDYKDHQGKHLIRLAQADKIAMADTLLHELHHAIIDIYNINLKDIEEEQLVLSVGTAQAQVYRDSPELLDYLSWLLT